MKRDSMVWFPPQTHTPTPKQTSAHTLDYRPDIDGMRAIAVMAVIIFHISPGLLPGGFVGVDIFFVISGFLISTHLFKAGQNGRLSLIDFYFRRIRRIVPAATVVVLATLLAAQVLLLPEDSKSAAKSAVWSFASMANVYFWLFQDTSYFAASSSELPLLHLWSLGVEEQFYLIWPFVVIAVCRWRFATLMGLLATVTCASFVFAELGFSHSPGFTYYMLPSRCGELLIGAMAALLVVSDKLGWVRRMALPLTIAGMALVLGSIAFLSEKVVFPGLWALPPTVGTALIILGGISANPLSRTLTTLWLRRIGFISYSAYLWHWPLLAFYRYGYGEPGFAAGSIIFAVTLLLAALTYRYIEQPVRHARNVNWKAGFAAWFAGSVVLAGLSVIFVYADRIYENSDSEYAKALAALRALDRPAQDFDYVCLRKALEAGDLTNPQCVLGKGDSPARVLLMGDSNAAHYVGIIGTFAQHAEFRFRNLEVGSCPPVFGEIRGFVDARRVEACTASHQVWRAALEEADIVVMGGTWVGYDRNSPHFLPALFEQVQGYIASNKQVVLLGKVPVIADYDRQCREKALRYPFKDCEASPNPVSAEVVQINKKLREFARSHPDIHYFDVEPAVCPGGACSAYGADGKSLFYDKHHLSMMGSWEVGRRIHAAQGVPPVFRLAASGPGNAIAP